VVSEVLRGIQAQAAVSGGFAVGGAWDIRFDVDVPLKFVGVVRGRVCLVADGIDPIDAVAGDVVMLHNRRWASMSGGPAHQLRQRLTVTPKDPFARFAGVHDDIVLGGHVEVNSTGAELLAAVLPAVVHVRAESPAAPQLASLLHHLYDEVVGDRLGAQFAVTRTAELLVLEVLRAYIAQSEQISANWVRLVADEQLRPAVQLIHAHPGRAWQLTELARAAAMSRTAFVNRFRSVAGVPPLTYLTTWRMQLAKRALHDGDTGIGALAIRLGYSSDSAFSTAFKRHVGMSPAQYRSTRTILPSGPSTP
jgi:AraC-like DNA-binding protein